MSDTDSLSDYPSDLEFIEEPLDFHSEYPLDSGIESNDGYLTDTNEDIVSEGRTTRNKRLFAKILTLRRFH